MRNKKNIIRTNLTIETIADGGVGLARQEGKVIFVEKTIPGDIVDVQITRKRSDYEQGYVLHYHTYSTLRVQPFCEHFGICGGCTWQQVSYETQLEFKQQLVADAFRRIGKFTELPPIEKILASQFDKYYRNKLEFTFSNKRWFTEKEIRHDEIDIKHPEEYPIKTLQPNALGFHIPGRFDKILNIEYCYLQPAPSNEIRLATRAYALLNHIEFYDLKNHTGYFRNIIIRTTTGGECMVIVLVADNKPDILFPFLQHLKETFSEITSLYYSINTKVNDYLYDLDVIHFSGTVHITEKIDSINYRLGPKSFFQTNPTQAKILYHIALQFADLKKEDIVYDFYTGLGSIALLAAGNCKKVIGVENIAAAIEDAKFNAAQNNILNCEFICGDMAKIFNDDFIVQQGKADVVITDPPRSGMHKDVVEQLLKLSPQKIVYVSCNPVTQARDIQLLSEKYTVIKLQPVDMFPQTYHAENVALLHLKD
ncbi:MAG: 23S rRNA (uracil(1939)-C(5))-methyltransferase RlmD [Fimbriimonadaceae bacterium]|nr:23S rRNA (uracil(1939)-C(5))-methyltransferase RlmD [Chitinophagales bacterium]